MSFMEIRCADCEYSNVLPKNIAVIYVLEFSINVETSNSYERMNHGQEGHQTPASVD